MYETVLGRRLDERPNHCPAFDMVVLAASRGGVEALPEVLRGLPGDFPAAVAVVLHISHPSSYLVEILRRRTALDVKWAEEGDTIVPGCVVVAPPDAHLLVNDDHTWHISHLPRQNYVRSSADLLFESASAVFGNRTLGVILSGGGRDGAIGACAVKQAGGRVLVQDRATSASFDMPRAAIETASVDFVLPLDQIASAVRSLVVVPGAADLFRVSSSFSYSHIDRIRGFHILNQSSPAY
ncbi:MAG TPA: chemotaxis protein CheB [Nitrospira sp.]|nr:chemotaxis protein CheB [Nitrospira sp.]